MHLFICVKSCTPTLKSLKQTEICHYFILKTHQCTDTPTKFVDLFLNLSSHMFTSQDNMYVGVEYSLQCQ